MVDWTHCIQLSDCDRESELLLGVFNDLNLYQHIHNFKRMRDIIMSISDLSLTSSLLIMHRLEFGHPVRTSDHVIIYIELEYFCICIEDILHPSINLFKINFHRDRNVLSLTNLANPSQVGTQEVWKHFKVTLLQTFEYFTLIRMRKMKRKPKWLDSKLRVAINLRNDPLNLFEDASSFE
ncbi:hypothetical protein GJ496_000180 [Pomphorhynchus laevis]|nr:hypothetical protein GJ496_000180 [Pomphorhynchus laevis]